MVVPRNFKDGTYRPWGERQTPAGRERQDFFVKKIYKPVLGQRGRKTAVGLPRPRAGACSVSTASCPSPRPKRVVRPNVRLHGPEWQL